MSTANEEVATPGRHENASIDLGQHAALLLIVCAIGLIGNWIATGTTPIAAFPGMAILYAMSMAGLAIAKFVPFYLPSVAWISAIAILLTIPGMPGGAWITAEVNRVNFLALATPCLAYAGLALSSNEIHIAKTSGWKIVIVAICVMFGTFIGSVVVADIILRLTG